MPGSGTAQPPLHERPRANLTELDAWTEVGIPMLRGAKGAKKSYRIGRGSGFSACCGVV